MQALRKVSFLIAIISATAFAAWHPSAARGEGDGPDLIVGDIFGIFQWTTNSGPIDGIRAYSIARSHCNIGTGRVNWFVGPSPNHPVSTGNLYRLKNGGFEQIGRGWTMHHSCALQQGLCLNELGTCQPVCGGCCNQLGVGCSTSNSITRAGQFGNLGPRSEINAYAGSNLGIHVFSEGNPTLRGRVNVKQADLEPSLNVDAIYFGEVHTIAADDALSMDHTGGWNNATHRRLNLNPTSFNMTPSGGTVRRLPAIYAWQANDPDIVIEAVDVPDEGRFHVGYRVTSNGDGTWHYEYAVHNLNSDRSAGVFSIPVPASLPITNVGFHDIDSHSGEIYDVADWESSYDGGFLTWSTTPFEKNELANALRWGTLYNFRFDAPTPPRAVNVRLGLFKPGAPPKVLIQALGPKLFGDSDDNGAIDLTDFAALVDCAQGPGINAVTESCDVFDIDGDTDVDWADVGAFMLMFSTATP